MILDQHCRDRYLFARLKGGQRDASPAGALGAPTSGAAGEFVGSDDWNFHDRWEQRLSTRSLTQITRLRTLFSTLAWWQLVPDTGSELVTPGRARN
jgi:hypothetical protein